jgi:hypothetical protein
MAIPHTITGRELKNDIFAQSIFVHRFIIFRRADDVYADKHNRELEISHNE